ncbi:hypothetical protein EV1_045004 [Malus domestica]
MAVGRIGRGLMAPLLVVNLVVHLIMLGLACWSLDKYINGEQNHPHLGGNTSTSFLLIFALIAGVVGAASVLYGLIHLRIWRTDSLADAASSAIVALTIIAFAFGLCKLIGVFQHTLEAMIAVSLLSQLLYLLLLHAGMFRSRHRHGGIGTGHDPRSTGATAVI